MSDMTFFDKLLDPETRSRFLAYREERRTPEFRMARMREYLPSKQYESDVMRIREGDYRISVPIKKLIRKSYTDKKRTVYHFQEDEMTIFRIMAHVLHDYEDLVSDDVYSFRRRKSAKDLIRKISSTPSLQKMHVVKSDLVSYGNSIQPERLIALLQEKLGHREPEAVAFFTWLLRRKQFLEDGEICEGDTAALPGCPVHNFFTNLYLEDTDRLIAPRCALYARYSDDIIFYTKSREEAQETYSLLLEEFESHGLTTHEDEKTGIYEPGEPYDYLGFHFDGAEVDIAKSSLKKLKRRMRMRAKRIGLDKKKRYPTPEEKAKRLIYLNHRTFYGKPDSNDLSWDRWAFPVITRTDTLHELDLYSQRCIRFLLTGKWSDCQYRIPYDTLKELGYESLVRAYYREKDMER